MTCSKKHGQQPVQNWKVKQFRTVYKLKELRDTDRRNVVHTMVMVMMYIEGLF